LRKNFDRLSARQRRRIIFEIKDILRLNVSQDSVIQKQLDSTAFIHIADSFRTDEVPFMTDIANNISLFKKTLLYYAKKNFKQTPLANKIIF